MKCYIQTEHRVISADLRKDVIEKGVYWTCAFGLCNVFKKEKDAIENAQDYIKDCINYHRRNANIYSKMLKKGIKVE